MKKIAIAILLFSQAGVNAQVIPGTGSFPVKGEPVIVRDWGSRALIILSDSYFDATKDSIISKIGQEEFEEMQKRCSTSGWPDGFYKSGLSDDEDKAYDEKLGRLKMYRIASYTHIYNGKVFDRYAILRVPFEENKSLDPAIVWKGNIYFLLHEKDVELIDE